MERKTEAGIQSMTSFIPKKFAQLGRVLKLKSDDGVWTNGWVVKLVGHTMDEPPDLHKSVRQHRERTGDSLPKVQKDRKT
tara:strand:- start:220 stop:459 length:240 start_codon:yes stop_codon:yes gene_type:complete